MDTCRTTKFDIEKSLTIEIYSPKDHNFTKDVTKVEIFLDDNTTYLVEDIDYINDNLEPSNDETVNLLRFTALTAKKWKSLLNTNAECSPQVYKVLDSENRRYSYKTSEYPSGLFFTFFIH